MKKFSLSLRLQMKRLMIAATAAAIGLSYATNLQAQDHPVQSKIKIKKPKKVTTQPNSPVAQQRTDPLLPDHNQAKY